MIRPREEMRRTNERPHVLIVTDDPSLAEFLAEGLPLGGFWTSVIASGLQALEVFRLRQFDLIVIDIGLSSFDALEFVRRLRGTSTRVTNTAPRTAAPIITIATDATMLNVRDDEQQSLGIEATLQAPLELDDVVRELHGVFARWREAHPDQPLADAAASLNR